MFLFVPFYRNKNKIIYSNVDLIRTQRIFKLVCDRFSVSSFIGCT